MGFFSRKPDRKKIASSIQALEREAERGCIDPETYVQALADNLDRIDRRMKIYHESSVYGIAVFQPQKELTQLLQTAATPEDGSAPEDGDLNKLLAKMDGEPKCVETLLAEMHGEPKCVEKLSVKDPFSFDNTRRLAALFTNYCSAKAETTTETEAETDGAGVELASMTRP